MSELRTVRGTRDFLPEDSRSFRLVEDRAQVVASRWGYGEVATPIMEKRVWSENGGPWRWHDGNVEYDRNMCPRSLDLMSRAVHLDISPDLSSVNVEELAAAVVKVLDALL